MWFALLKEGATWCVFRRVGPVKGELELCSLGDSLSISQGARHAAENAVVDLDHLVDGLG